MLLGKTRTLPYNLVMPEFGSYKKKNDESKKKSSEIVSAYSEEGKRRQKKAESLNRLYWGIGLALGAVGLALLIYFVVCNPF